MKLAYLENIIVGCWQLASGHTSQAVSGLKVLESYYEAGFRVFDCADIYTGVEELLGTFIRSHGLKPEDIKVHTKCVPDLAALPSVTPEQLEAGIDRSRLRLGLERLDLVQFHWWDYGVPRYMEALEALQALKEQGKISEIGLTNFSAEHLKEMIAHGVPIASIQTQYSVLDRRPKAALAPLAEAHGVAVLCYGSVAGGLLSDHYLGQEALREPLENRSLVKYMLILGEVGGWDALQALLEVLREIGDEKNTDVATVASAYCLAQKGVRACIVGVRNTRHLERHQRLRDGLRLSSSDLARIERVREAFKEVPGEVYELERDQTGRHGRIMKYNLNTGRG